MFLEAGQKLSTHKGSSLQVPVGSDYRLSAAAVKRHINRNTVLIVASCPGFPHGVVDHVTELGRVPLLSLNCQIMHSKVDPACCLGKAALPASICSLSTASYMEP